MPVHPHKHLFQLLLAFSLCACASTDLPLIPPTNRPPVTATAQPLTPTLPPTASPAATAAQPTGMPTAASETPLPSSTAAPTQYTVAAGDTIWAIALQFGLAPEQLLDANPNVNPDLLHPGDVLVIPNPSNPPPTRTPGPSPTLPPATRAPVTGGVSVLNTLSGVTDHARAVFALGQTLGNRPDVFSKVGDSITASPVYLNPIGLGLYNLRDYGQFQAVIDYYSSALARGDANSFSNVSLAAKVNWRAQAVLNPDSADHTVCLEGEAPLPCEFRLVRPAVALIMLGTNDVPSTSDTNFEADYRRVIEYCLAQGVIPVVSTIPPLFRTGLDGRSEELNVIITRLAQEYDVPLWDYWSALQGLPNAGIANDGVHPNSAPAGHSADFAQEYLQYGMVVRNLTALDVLDQIWRQVIQP